jgi:hypothetical protein
MRHTRGGYRKDFVLHGGATRKVIPADLTAMW